MTAPLPSARSKLFVLDTNVILHDAGCLWNFKEHDIAVPITVLEELDKFKKGNEAINFQARAFLRRLDELTSDVFSEEGTSLGSGLGRIRVVLRGDHGEQLRQAFFSDAPDHRILDIALTLQDHEQPRSVILVTKDTNLRLKAKSMGLPAQDYNSDKVESFEKLYTGKRLVVDLPSDVISQFFTASGDVPTTHLPMVEDPIANENFILRNGSKSVLATYHSDEKVYSRLEKISASGITPRNAEQAFALSALMDDSIKLVTIGGKAGSGKTLLAMAAALECRSRYRQTLLARPVVSLSNRDLGFLPGDVNAKLDPYMQPLYDNLAVVCAQLGESDVRTKLDDLLVKYRLEVTPLAYIRGRSLQRVFFIVDEAQNLTPHEVKTIITRAGEGTKIVLTGDIQQIDHPYLDSLSNGLTYLINRMVGQSIYAHITLEKGERSALAELASNLL
ncbi:PhoH family protein [Schlesneria paludicola]|uniref:PhoH family protein n=1 Tax=Schlesneria paludicola TaxID=360056 RepID=UPI00029A795B|nr:PhoH family protein [Schlesneria paludicola]